MSTPSGIWAVVPVKEFAAAKQRLASALDAEQRRELAIAMAEDVIEMLTRVTALAGILVVTDDPTAVAIARRHGASTLGDGAGEGHTGAVAAGMRRLVAENRAGLLTLPGDVPAASAAEIEELIAGHGAAPAFSIVPAHDRRGSNAVLCSPPDLIPLRFGDDSFLPHLAAARARGLAPRIVELPGIGLDIDNPDELARFMARPSAARSWAYLAGRGFAPARAAPELVR
jgi:2-phospho-L-lactate guanylyltransferase